MTVPLQACRYGEIMEDVKKEENNCSLACDYDAERLWETLIRFQNHIFRTAKNLEFTYII